MEHTMKTWKMTSTSPGIGIHSTDNMLPPPLRQEQFSTHMSTDDRQDNGQSIVDENEEWAKVNFFIFFGTFHFRKSYLLS